MKLPMRVLAEMELWVGEGGCCGYGRLLWVWEVAVGMGGCCGGGRLLWGREVAVGMGGCCGGGRLLWGREVAVGMGGCCGYGRLLWVYMGRTSILLNFYLLLFRKSLRSLRPQEGPKPHWTKTSTSRTKPGVGVAGLLQLVEEDPQGRKEGIVEKGEIEEDFVKGVKIGGALKITGGKGVVQEEEVGEDSEVEGGRATPTVILSRGTMLPMWRTRVIFRPWAASHPSLSEDCRMACAYLYYCWTSTLYYASYVRNICVNVNVCS